MERNQLLKLLKSHQPVFWVNPKLSKSAKALSQLPIGKPEMEDALDRMTRCSTLLETLFPILKKRHGIIESKLLEISSIKPFITGKNDASGLYLKADNQLPVVGSIKARGGFYEVLCIAETLAIDAGLVRPGDDLDILASPAAQALFATQTISVGSTGNLGLSVGTLASALGFRAQIHMSSDAKDWKKQRLKAAGVEVIEHTGDYAIAVMAARNLAQKSNNSHFIDDENSLTLFLGYSIAAYHLVKQLDQNGIKVDKENPLFVYLPCGVGGAPGGITFGLKQLLGDHVHCFLAEPTASACMLTRLAFGRERFTAVYDLGLDNKTEADGLAVASASELVADLVRELVSGVYTVTDEEMLRWLYLVDHCESMLVEPAAAVGFSGPAHLRETVEGKAYIEQQNLQDKMANSTHLIWATGGNLVPKTIHKELSERGRAELTQEDKYLTYAKEKNGLPT